MSDPTCVSNVVFGFVLTLVMLFAFGFGIGGTVYFGTRSRRALEAEAERVQRDRDELRDKEVKVHSTAVQHYMGEVSHWRSEFERLQHESATFKKLLDQNGVNWQRASVMTMTGERDLPVRATSVIPT